MTKRILVAQALAQALVDYLKKRPYEEVFQLIGGLLQAPPEEEKPCPQPSSELKQPS